ncbi:Oidioi.mRNA.OKI2018_I69.chr1.g1539.t1.cds [Oikopleura dioica]|uniref:Oidioi.mRNA.OKI2018_I69.chr1.g1539.t1.cds n=1 Tax=Oikopleura dioica TaxID=34765 RepID=A0ABN7SN81_OIKDI|nr:Oidioi.mRNA.OKI2018_I69.chr1.g1539.t1.cds [Oikopleura dioica]
MCASNDDCMNNGKCVFFSDRWMCRCTFDFSGDFCQLNAYDPGFTKNEEIPTAAQQDKINAYIFYLLAGLIAIIILLLYKITSLSRTVTTRNFTIRQLSYRGPSSTSTV